MKHFKNFLLAATLFFTATASAQNEPLNNTGLTFKEDTHNFGDIELRKPASYDFTLTNTSDKAITITQVKPSCGCTVPSYRKTAIKPGESAAITATYDAHYTGSFSKTLTVKTDAGDKKQVLHIKGKVVNTAH